MTGGRDKASILADGLESLFGAVFLDHGLDISRDIILAIFDDVIGKAGKLGAGLDWKTSLQELSSERELGPPQYQITSTGPDHDRSSPPLPSSGARIWVRVWGGPRRKPSRRPRPWPGTCSTTVRRRFRKTTSPKAAKPQTVNPAGSSGPRVPELPEVETIRLGLAAHIVGRRIEHVEVLHPRAVRRQAGGAVDLIARLRGLTITDVRRRGKYLWLNVGSGEKLTDDGWAVVIHLGMSGQLLIAEPGAPTRSTCGSA